MEIFYFVFSIILLSCGKYQAKYKNIIKDLKNTFSSQISYDNKEYHIEILNERYELYKNSLLDREPGPRWYLSNCFLSMVLVNIPDPEGQWLLSTLLKNIEVTRIVSGTIDFVNKLFNKYKIII